MKIVSWNVNSIRKNIIDQLKKLVDENQPDIICFQETKAKKCDAEKYFKGNELLNVYKYRYWNDSIKGHAGVSVWSKIEPLKEEIIENDVCKGRVIILYFNDFVLLNTYVPNTGQGTLAEDKRREWHNVIKTWLTNQQYIVWTGDLNVVDEPLMDTTHSKCRKDVAGLKQFEKDQFEEYKKMGLIDVFRHLHPDVKSYTWRSNFNHSIKWRLDYFLTTIKIKSIEHLTNYTGSDHIPIMLYI